MRQLRVHLERILTDPSHPYFGRVNGIISLVTVISILAVILETVPELSGAAPALAGVEYGVLAFFTAEYLVRMSASPRRLRYAASVSGVIDLLAILPSYLILMHPWGFGLIRILRLARVLRFAKVVRHRQAMLAMAMQKKTHTRLHLLNLEIYFLALGSAVLLLASAYYAVEGHQPAFATMPLSILWIVETLFGGSISRALPETIAGEVVSVVTRFVGAVLFGFLIAVVGGFVARFLFGTERLEE
ncbi:MAG: ion transporter [Patescibacteria group bacterium]